MTDFTDGYSEAKKRIQAALEYKPDALYLNGLSLRDLPPELAEVTSITHLNLEFNEFETLPDVLLKLPQLKSVYIERNPLRTLPDWIGELTQLEGLNFYECELNEIPASIGKLINLDHFELSGNQLKALPNTIGNLIKLETFGLSVNHLESLPESFGNLESLTDVSLGFNKLEELPVSFVELPKLEYVDLRVNQVRKLPENFYKLSTLKGLNVSDNPIDTLPAQLPVLELLDICRCPQLVALPPDLKVSGTLNLGGQKLTSIPDGCKNATFGWFSTMVQERFVAHPETITKHDILTAKDHFVREALLNFMGYDQLLREVEVTQLDESKHDNDTLKLVKIEISDSEAETYLIIMNDQHEKYEVQWVLSKFQTCTDAYNWRNRVWTDSS